MNDASFGYDIYIHGRPEDVWKGLVDPEVTRRYWFHEMVSDLSVGSEWSHRRTDGSGKISVGGKVLEVDPPRRLVLSWALPDTEGDASQVSRVAFDISSVEEWPHGPWAALRLDHTELEPGSDMLRSMTFGWPAVLSGLKSVIERPDIFESG